jgi:hypothetical protein
LNASRRQPHFSMHMRTQNWATATTPA